MCARKAMWTAVITSRNDEPTGGITVAQKLREVIMSAGHPLGETEPGSAWCVKALHPADPLTEVMGVPDQSAGPTTFLNYMQQTLIAPPTVGQTWECEIHLLTDPAIPAIIYKRTSSNSNVSSTLVFNKALGDGATIESTCQAWLAEFERWRLGYAGASVYLNAPATASQGSCTAAQHATAYTTLNVGLDGITEGLHVPAAKTIRFQANDCPSYDALVGMPNAYTGNAVEGCYMPLKLDSNHAVWHTPDDYVYDASIWATSNAGLSYVVPVSGQGVGSLYGPCNNLYYSLGASNWYGTRHLLPTSGILGTIAFRGLSDQATLNLVMRTGFECQVQPGSAFMPYLHLSPAFDPTAITTYFKIARELKDAYPVDYNDLGKLWGVIKQAAKVVNPFLDAVPGGAVIRGVGKVVGTLGDAYTSKGGKAPDIVSEADLERVRAAGVAARNASLQAAKPRKGPGASKTRKPK